MYLVLKLAIDLLVSNCQKAGTGKHYMSMRLRNGL